MVLFVRKDTDMPKNVGFHFVLLAVGEVLTRDYYASAQRVQDFICNDDAFGVRVPLKDCRLALELLHSSGFIDKINNGFYERHCD